ncbi:hypothetical protein J4209_03740 [Candidatus Woesearchaeota archaeon]|nr:hypothetical protein [Candidatus Woesearchaeota archaeon]
MRVLSIFPVFLLSLVLLPDASAVGIFISPIEDIYFEPNLQTSLDFGVKNNAGSDMHIGLAVGGDLAKYTSISTGEGNPIFVKAGETKGFQVVFNFPEHIEEPGEHILKILADEQPREGGAFSVTSSVSSRITVHVPYPGRYVIWEFITDNGNVNETINFRFIVNNLGKEDIKNARGVVDIYGPSEEGFNTKIGAIASETSEILSTKITTLNAILNTTGYRPGEYRAVGTLFYDEGKDAKEGFFRIGSLYVRLADYTKKFRKDSIEKLNLNVESGWNSRIDDAYAIISIKDREDITNVFNELKTPSFYLKAWENKNISTYWDTHGLEVGAYNADIAIYYRNTTTIENVNLEVIEEKGSPLFNITALLIIIIVILVIGDVILLMRKRKKKPSPKAKK